MHSCEAEGNKAELKAALFSCGFSPAGVLKSIQNPSQVNLSEPQFPHRFVVRISLGKICTVFGTERSIH